MSSSEPLPGRCGSPLRNKPGEFCTQRPRKGKKRCDLHGGSSLAGADAGSFKHGRYSRHIPTRIVKDYEQAANDPERLSIDHEIGLVEARLKDVLSRVDTGEAGRLWKQLRTTYDAAIDAQRSGDNVTARDLLSEVGKMIRQGQGDWAVWDEVMRLVDRRARLVETEMRRQEKMRQFVTEDQARTFYRAVILAVRDNEPDPKVRRAIFDAIAHVTGERESGIALTG